MCGITGKIYLAKDRNINPAELKNMTDIIRHRGPDDEGFYIDRNVGLGFRRLSIIDLHTGRQPLSNEDGTIWIIFNGEIYNYKELQQKLISQGHIFRTQSDTETIVHLYEQYGPDCVNYLNGMFSFAIWDSNIQQLFCARDRFGIKPFYYYCDNEKFVFGSEIKAILRSEKIDKTLSYTALDSYFAFGNVTGDLSIYKNISKLQPAHYLLLSFKEKFNITIKRYWDIEFNPDFSKTEEYWMKEIEECFSKTVKNHMISDVPLGAFLSGGIDSSSVVAMMAKNSSIPVKTFSIGFKEQEFNELKYAREIAAKYGCEHYERIIEPESIGLLPKLVNAYDEPFADSSAIPTYYVSKLAREYVTVALSGDGGDELFAGYQGYTKFKRINSFPLSFSGSFLNKLIWGNIHKLIPQSTRGKGLMYFLSQNKNFAYAYQTTWTVEERNKLITNNQVNIENFNAELFKEEILKNNHHHDFITNLQYLDMKTYLVDDILTKVDRASMMNSLEVRVPFLDHKFAELSFKIPWNLKLKNNNKKYILKRSMSKYLPESILSHPKQGFGVPLSLWFKDDLREYLNDTLLNRNPLLSAYLDKDYVRKIVENNRKGKRDFSAKIWSLVFFEEWLKQNQVN